MDKALLATANWESKATEQEVTEILESCNYFLTSNVQQVIDIMESREPNIALAVFDDKSSVAVYADRSWQILNSKNEGEQNERLFKTN